MSLNLESSDSKINNKKKEEEEEHKKSLIRIYEEIHLNCHMKRV